MATKDDRIEVQWATHSDPKKVGEKEKLAPHEARAVVRTGLARFVDQKDAPAPKPSMNTREDALKASRAKSRPAVETQASTQADAKK